MAVSTTTRQTWHTGDDVTTVFAYAFQIAQDSELEVVTRVIATGVETTLVLDTDYTVSGEGVATGGNVTLATALASTKIMTIRGKLPLTQTTDIKNQGSYYAATHETAFDRRVGVDQQQQHEINRCVKFPVTYSPATYDPSLPTPVASAAIGFNSAGTGLTTITSLGGTTVTAFWVSMLDDTTAAASLATLSAALTTETSPATGDLFPYYDASSTAGRQITLENMLKVIASLTEDASPVPADQLVTYDASASGPKKVLIGAATAGAQQAGWFSNAGLAAATTTNANDSIKFTGATAALSSTNPLYVNVMSAATVGLVTRLSATADVTINLTGAHWGYGTNGDLTGSELYAYLINDAGTLKYGVSVTAGYTTITQALSSATATDINLTTEMLVNSTLSATSTCMEIGKFLANFDDTGGAAEDLWAVQTTVGQMNVGVPLPRAPITTNLNSGSGTFTVSSNPRPLYLRVLCVGGGGGGGGSGTSAGTAATAGGNTTFGPITANGGAIGARDGAGGAGGSASIFNYGFVAFGGSGGGSARQAGAANAEALPGGVGGNSFFGGGGGGGDTSAVGTAAGGNGATNTGGGGGGASILTNVNGVTGSGGGAGGFAEAILHNPQASYSYSVGTGGTGQTAGGTGSAGGNGAAGKIVIFEHFQ